jgi:hypothetical protein
MTRAAGSFSLHLTALFAECNPSLQFVRGLMSDLTRLATRDLRLRLGFRNLKRIDYFGPQQTPLLFDLVARLRQ